MMRCLNRSNLTVVRIDDPHELKDLTPQRCSAIKKNVKKSEMMSFTNKER